MVSTEDSVGLLAFSMSATDDDGVSGLSDESVDVDTEVTKGKMVRGCGGK